METLSRSTSKSWQRAKGLLSRDVFRDKPNQAKKSAAEKLSTAEVSSTIEYWFILSPVQPENSKNHIPKLTAKHFFRLHTKLHNVARFVQSMCWGWTSATPNFSSAIVNQLNFCFGYCWLALAWWSWRQMLVNCFNCCHTAHTLVFNVYQPCSNVCTKNTVWLTKPHKDELQKGWLHFLCIHICHTWTTVPHQQLQLFPTY